ncbi:ribonuclease 2 isoform X2 [Ziziphus jujuba]|uniref:Ribonuclease 2 isoform X2 n=1 Tax=Ziziphus jujuba TaxID=326968 RepID=A0A6P4AD10_ZIZJJ|nr:ribonuclease 2 isoform X2 [Ziziphus jujuba]
MKMASLFAQLLCILMITMASIAIIEAKRIGIEIGSREVAEFREFDYFVLALQWPGTFCHRTDHCCSSNACCRRSNAPTEFTIHGLWPDYNDGTWPACCTHESFDEKEISTLLDALEKYWPSLSCGKPSTCHGGKGSFWAHEWEKHGTCSSPVVHDEYSYFLTTLNVYFKHNVTSVLKEAGYVPSNKEKYPLGGIISAVQNAFGATPLLICKNGAVEELRLCFYKDFKPRDCVIGSTGQSFVLSSRSSCPHYVSLPIPEYASFGVESAETTISSVLGDEAL